MTQEDKYYIGGGLALCAFGIGYWLFNRNNSVDTSKETIDTTYEDVTNQPVVKIPSKATPPFTTVAVDEEPMKEPLVVAKDKFYYRVGQEVMANYKNGTKTYQVKKLADGNYATNGQTMVRAFNYGDKIGKIIWVGKRADGTYRYVVEREGNFIKTLHWIANVNGIKPIGKILSPMPVLNTEGLVLTRILHKGVYNSEEVKELQRRLGLVADGDFGTNTENALFAKKKVKQIRLADWK